MSLEEVPVSLQTLLVLFMAAATLCGMLAGGVQVVLAYAFGFGELKSDVKAMRKSMETSEEQQRAERERHDRAMEAVWHEFGELREVTSAHGERISAVESRCKR